jgi:predicted lipoprotein with Yx(FWY)xxD motif
VVRGRTPSAPTGATAAPDQEGTIMGIRHRLALTGIAAAAVMVLSGCAGFGNGSSSAGDSGGESSPQGAQAAVPPAQPKIRWTLMTASTKKLGKIMVDGKGMTLYRFDKDSARPSLSRCYGTCARKWPPVTIKTTNLVLKGFDATLLGRIHRRDGTWQLTLNGWPLYHYYKDTKAGVWTGQGVEGTWFVSAINGKKALAKTPASSGAGSQSGSSSSGGSGGTGGSGGSDSGGGGYDTGGDGGYGSGGGGY